MSDSLSPYLLRHPFRTGPWAVHETRVDDDRSGADLMGQIEGGLQLAQVLCATLGVVGRRADAAVDEVYRQVYAVGGRQRSHRANLGLRDRIGPQRPGAQLESKEPVLDGELNALAGRDCRWTAL